MHKKSIILFFTFLTITCTNFTYAQKDKSQRPSPPAQVADTLNDLVVVIDYSQPAVKERKIWDGLVPFGKIWRTGANEASWIEVSRDVKINGEELPAGKYGLFTIPNESEWTIVFNEVWNQWGAYDYDESKDVLRVKATPEQSDDFNERFTIDISPEGVVTLNWEETKVPFTIE